LHPRPNAPTEETIERCDTCEYYEDDAAAMAAYRLYRERTRGPMNKTQYLMIIPDTQGDQGDRDVTHLFVRASHARRVLDLFTSPIPNDGIVVAFQPEDQFVVHMLDGGEADAILEPAGYERTTDELYSGDCYLLDLNSSIGQGHRFKCIGACASSRGFTDGRFFVTLLAQHGTCVDEVFCKADLKLESRVPRSSRRPFNGIVIGR
jgi:hypothetical protein